MNDVPKKEDTQEKPLNDLKRLAKCSDCGAKVDSWDKLPWFIARPEREYDEFYCGCRGWD